MADLVPIKTFLNRVEADFALDVLKAAGIPGVIVADDAGGMIPIGLSPNAVSVCVNREDAEDAVAVLEAASAD